MDHENPGSGEGRAAPSLPTHLLPEDLGRLATAYDVAERAAIANKNAQERMALLRELFAERYSLREQDRIANDGSIVRG